jgi:hypothetical protein
MELAVVVALTRGIPMLVMAVMVLLLLDMLYRE